MKNVLLTVGGILLAIVIVTAIYLGTFRNAAEGAQQRAASKFLNRSMVTYRLIERVFFVKTSHF